MQTELILIGLIILLGASIGGMFVWTQKAFRMQKHLQKTITHLEIRLKETSHLLIQKNAELFDQNTRMETIAEVKSDFIGIASHQLRTPLTEIKWAIEYLEETDTSKLSNIQKQYLKQIHESAKHMLGLITDLLRLMRIEEGYSAYEIQPCDIEQLIKNKAQEISSKFSSKKIALSYRFSFGNDPLYIDKEMVEIALFNLIENAFHYTPSRGRITLITKQEGDQFYFGIKDSGIGIEQEHRHYVFEKFKRTDRAIKMNPSGTGLGLYLVKNVILRHYGDVGFESAKDKGSLFYFTLPVAPPLEMTQESSSNSE